MIRNKNKDNQLNVKNELRALFSELFGTFALTFTASAATVVPILSHYEIDYLAKVTAPGLMVMAIIYALGDISGTHINPAVTFAFSLRRAFPWKKMPFYWLAQVVGSLLAAFVILMLFGNIEHLGATTPHFGVLPSFIMEIILTLFLVTVIIGTATGSKIVGHNAGIAVGATIILCGIIGSPISGASMNPALSIGPSLLSREVSSVWIYIAGPLLGSLLAVGINYLTHGSTKPQEKEAASGKGDKP